MTPDRWRRIEEVFQGAAERSIKERLTYLQEVCRGDDELRHEVESLLEQQSSGGLLDGPVWEAGGNGRLGPYRILERIGAGGMGAVYKALDTRLNRTVAIKVSQAQFTSRFEREARAIAALNHPHVCILHDVGPNYLVMEYVEGETLAARLRRGPLRFEQVRAFGAQIADALAAAHAHGIIHRDLKPGNIMLTKAGVKVLDFGLAKIADADGSRETLTASHAIVGTLAYMSPEQLEGKPADARSDIFALGSVLYEMASGRRAFNSESQAGLISEVMRGEVAPIAGVPEGFAEIVRRCLERDPDRRWQSAADLKLELEAETDARRPRQRQTAGRRSLLLPITAAASLFCGFATCLYFTEPPLPDQSRVRIAPFAVDARNQCCAVWSRDGKTVAFQSNGQVFVREVDSDVPQQLTFSPEAARPIGWTKDGNRVLFGTVREPSGVWSVARIRGDPEPVLALDSSSYSSLLQNHCVAASPTGEALAVLKRGDDRRRGVWISSPPGAPLRKYSPDPFSTRSVINVPFLSFSPDGKAILLFINGDNGPGYWLLPFPPRESQTPRQVLRIFPELNLTPDQMPTFAWMPDSRSIVLSTGRLWLADTLSGRYQGISAGPNTWTFPAVSPSGQALIYTDFDRDFDIVSADLDGSIHRLIATQRSEQMPAWAARRQAMVYVSDRNGPMEIWLREGETDHRIVASSQFQNSHVRSFGAPALSPGADRVIYSHSANEGSRLWISSTAGGAPVPLTDDDAPGVIEAPGSWSPDGSWFTYPRVRAGVTDLMKVRTTGQGKPVRLGEGRSGVPAWSPTGEWILYGEFLVSPDGKSVRSLGQHGSPHYVFAADGKIVYGLRPEGDHQLLFSVNIASGVEKRITLVGNEFRPAALRVPGIRFSLAPDGKSFAYSVVTAKSTLWLMEGFAPKTGLLARLGLPWK